MRGTIEEWMEGTRLASRVFDLDRRLPDRVSSLVRAEGFWFFDGEVTFGADAWPLLSSLARHFFDPDVFVMTLDPEESFFIDTPVGYPVFRCSASSGPEEYVAGLFGDDRMGDPEIVWMAEVVAVVGRTGRWGVWVERNVGGLVVTDGSARLGPWLLDNGPHRFLSAAEALEADGFMSLNVSVGSTTEFGRLLLDNY